ANRTIEKAKKLRDDCPYEVQTEVLSLDRAEEKLEAYDCIIQTTSIGMAPDTGAEPLKLHRLKKDAFVSDIIYNPPETKFLRSAVEKGAKVQNGLNMFVYQGALAFEKWTGIFPDVEPMKQIVLEKLGGKTC
ncbi:MAG: shikimate dehydrogenase, partial [Bacillales bacterium]